MVQVAAEGARGAGAEVTEIDLKEYPLPVYDGDLEEAEGLPENAVKLKELFLAHDGLLIASPEYNGAITAALKNLIDWISRPGADEKPLACFSGKVAVIMACSPGGLGGIRGLPMLRAILGGIGVVVLPDQKAMPQAHEKFAAEGGMKEGKEREQVLGLGRVLAETAGKLNA